MKKNITLLTLAFVVTAGFTACTKKTEVETAKVEAHVDTAKLEASFATAEPATKSNVDQAIDSIKKADYASALAQLQTTLASGKLTPEQQQSIKSVTDQLQKLAVDNLNKAADGANKAIGDMQKSISK